MIALVGSTMIGASLVLLAAGFRRRHAVRSLADEIGYRPPGMPRPLATGPIGAIAGRRVAGTGAGRRLALDLPRAGIRRPPAEFMVLMGGSTLLMLLAMSAIGGLATGIIVAAAFVWGMRTVIRRRARAYVERFDDALPDALDLLAGSLEAGSSLAQAMELVAEEGSPPLSVELDRILSETRLGTPLAEAMASAADRIGSRDFGWVVRGVRAQQEHGASLAGLLRTASEFMRARREMHGEVRALTAEGRISAAILIALPFAVAGFFWIANPGYLQTLTSSPVGVALLGFAAAAMAGGTFWLTRIVKVEV